MVVVIELLSGLCLLVGAFFTLVGGIGVLRFPDFYSRLHASGIIDTLGAGMILLGLLLQVETFDVAVRLVLIFLFLLLTVPTATHALGKAALRGGLRPELDDREDGPSTS